MTGIKRATKLNDDKKRFTASSKKHAARSNPQEYREFANP
jgi:hypothetical protein